MNLWKPDLPIKQLERERIINHYITLAETLYQDLEQNRLEVILIPAPRPAYFGHMVRVADNENPEWYRELFKKYFPNFRRDRSLRSLQRIAEKRDERYYSQAYRYDYIYRELITQALLNGIPIQETFIPPENEVRIFFGEKPIIIQNKKPTKQSIKRTKRLERIPVMNF